MLSSPYQRNVDPPPTIGLKSSKYVETFGLTREVDPSPTPPSPPNPGSVDLSENPRKISGLKRKFLGLTWT